MRGTQLACLSLHTGDHSLLHDKVIQQQEAQTEGVMSPSTQPDWPPPSTWPIFSATLRCSQQQSITAYRGLSTDHLQAPASPFLQQQQQLQLTTRKLPPMDAVQEHCCTIVLLSLHVNVQAHVLHASCPACLHDCNHQPAGHFQHSHQHGSCQKTWWAGSKLMHAGLNSCSAEQKLEGQQSRPYHATFP